MGKPTITDVTLRVHMECPRLCPRCSEWAELDDMVDPIGGEYITSNPEMICPECKRKQNPVCTDCYQESDYECLSCDLSFCCDCVVGNKYQNIRKKCPICGKFVRTLEGTP